MFYEERIFRNLLYTLLVLLIIFVLGKLDFVLVPLRDAAALILVPILIGGLLYYILRPLVREIEKRRIERTQAVVIVLTVAVLALAGIVMYGGNAIVREFADFYAYFNEQLKNAGKSTRDIFVDGKILSISSSQITGYLASIVQVMFTKFGKNILGVFPTIAGIGTQLILIPFALFYFLKDGERLLPAILKIFPEKSRKEAKAILKDVDSVIAGYTTGQLMVAVIIGILMYIGYIIIKLPNALALSFFAMITSIIPFLGPFLGILPALLIGVTIDMFYIIKIVLLSAIVQQVESKLISPNIIGTRLDMHPLTIIVIIIIAISLFGLMGAFVAVPSYAVAKMLIGHYIRIKRSQQN